MPFGEVYTSLQTGVVECAENGYTVYMLNKHYEVAPIMSVTEHEANHSVLFVSDKVWSGLSAEQKKWVQQAADDMNGVQPAKAFEMERESRAKLQKMGVKIVEGVAITGFTVTVTCDIVTRLLGRPWLWLQEVTMTFFIYGVFIGTAAATRRNDHLYLAVIAESLSGAKRTALETFSRLVVLAVAFCLIWFGYLNFLDSS